MCEEGTKLGGQNITRTKGNCKDSFLQKGQI